MKLTKTHWIIIAVLAVVVIYFLFFRKKDGKNDESSYKYVCGPDERGTCVGCTPTQCPPQSSTPGAQSQGCQCFDGACLPACSADGGSYVYNPSTGWSFVSRKRKRAKKSTSFMS
jgi:hypothetical protein